MKQCTKCGNLKEKVDFSKKQSWCKACLSQNAREWYAAHRKEAKGRMKSYYAANFKNERERKKQYHAEHRKEMNAYALSYRAAHLEERRAHDRAYYATHCEEARAYSIAYHAAHPEETKARQKTYLRTHRAQFCARNAARRAAELRQTLVSVNPKEIEEFYRESDRLTKETGIRYSVDHIVPLLGKYVRGLHVPWNLQIIPLIDNFKKGNRFMVVQ